MKKQRRKAPKSFSAPTLYEAAIIPAKSRTYVYVAGASAGWYQLKNDGLKFMLSKQQVVEEKNGHASKPLAREVAAKPPTATAGAQDDCGE